MILAIDIGTSRVKGALFDEEGKAIGRRSVPVAMSDSSEPSAHEMESEVWVAAVRDIATILGGDVEAVVISGNGPTLLPVDAEGRPLQAALSWMDRRATAEAARVSAAAGIPIDSSWALPKALWIKEHRPQIYEKTAAFLSCPEYLMRLLTGESATIVPLGYEPYYGTPEIFASLGLEGAKFPPSVRPGRFSAPVTEAGQDRLGIPAGALAIAAGPDYLAALVGTATTVPGRACDRAGTSEGVNLCAERGVNDPRLISVPHIVEPYANISGLISTTGAAMSWWKRAMARRDSTPQDAARGYSGGSYDDILDALSAVPAGARGLVFLPYLSGERSPIWDADARGAFIGLSLAHGLPEMGRAVLESTAFAMRDVIEVMEEDGAFVSELRATGKPTLSPLWNQVKADITGCPIAVPRFDDAELLGDLAFALVASKRYANLPEAAEDLVKIGSTYEPDPANEEVYDGLFEAYRSSYAALKPVFKAMAASAKKASPRLDA
jgi:xylulokinase